ncbi:nucleolar protein 6 [Pieris rapae]|uniref:nucleolar protein 6 n=1 Tax=Pieris rapae TaxID=64459 RepID=UPI001E2803D9|nr:nucleolar protein 6 [Pieris rapae]
MVKRQMKSSKTDDDDESNILNENGKRPAEDASKENKKRTRIKNLYRQPTAKELNRLNETENLFNSNLFRLQIDEVLDEVKLAEKTTKRFTVWFNSFREYLLSINEDNIEYDLSEKTITKHLKASLPVCEKLNKTKVMFQFHKFKDINIVGSYDTGTAINASLYIDLQILVPAETYTKNDSINYRFHKKRAAYLAFIASYLQKTNLVEELKYSWCNMCVTKPVIDLKPSGKLGNYLTVRLNLVCEEEAYKLHRFSPGRNNLRESWLLTEKQENVTEVGPPTPYYNCSVLSDLTANINNNFVKETLSNSENLKQAIILLKIWLRQRKLCVSGHIISLLVCCLVKMKRINNIMSSYQIIRNVWIYLKTSKWDTEGLSLCKSEDSPHIGQFLEHFPVVFLDKTGYYNICWQMCNGTYNALRRESELAVDMLDSEKINSFIPLFMVPISNLTQFDYIVRFQNLQKLKSLVLQRVSKEDRINFGVDELPLVVNNIYKLLTKGLTDRADLILQLVEADFSWPVKKTPEKCNDLGFEEKLSFGLIMNSANAIKLVDKGPQANLPEAEEFRLFWGEKSELRRFGDGSHVEACVWNADTFSERRAIATQIVDYLMKLKYDVQQSEIFHICNQLDSLTARKMAACEQSEELSVKVLQTFDELRRDMRALTQLPLEISAVYGTSSVFSYSNPLPPLPSTSDPRVWKRASTCLIKPPQEDKKLYLPPYTQANKAVIELSHSGKWPGEIEAFRCLKAAFHLQISERLTSQYSLPSQAYPTHIDVIKNGFSYRLEIFHPKEVTLLRREVEEGVVKFKESEESIRIQRDTFLLASLRGALHGLHQRHSAFGPTACLLKRWLSSHLLSPPHFPDTLADLLTATVFLQPEPLTPPTQPTVGLYRVLQLLVQTDWATQIIFLDFNGDMTREEIMEIEQKFSNRTEEDPVMCIVTSYDGSMPSIWSSSAPSKQVVTRAQVLAKATLAYVEKALLKDSNDNLLPAFVPSYSGYDVLIHLNAAIVPYFNERVDARPKLPATTDVTNDVIPVLEFNPVDKYLEVLRSAYDEFALFFYDTYGGDVIAVLWKPHINDTREFQITNAHALVPIEGSDKKFKVNIEAIIEDFKILGEGIVKDVLSNS